MDNRAIEKSALPQLPSDAARLLGFMRRNLLRLLAWPAAALLLGGLLWASTLSELERDRQAVMAGAFKQTASLSRAYAEQLLRSVEQIDQITLSLKYDWEEPGVILDLERQREKGLYLNSPRIHALVINREGKLVTATGDPDDRVGRAGDDYFQRHKNEAGLGLLITGPEISRRYSRTVIRFSRRLTSANGSFDGVAMVVAEPAYLVSFYDESILDASDFITARHADGTLLASKVGTAGDTIRVFYRYDPVFATPSGVVIEPAEKFRDGLARIVAWKKLDAYPLVALAATTEQGVLAAHRAAARRQIGFAGAASAALFVFALLGMFLSLRLAWRKQQADEVKATYRLAVDAAREGFYMLRPIYDRNGAAIDFQVEDCNERAAALVGFARDKFIGLRLSQVYSGEYGRTTLETLRHALDTGFHEDEVRVSAQSRLKAGWVHRRAVRSGVGLALTIRDISDAKAHEEALSAMANVDALTGLPNRHWLTNFLPRALEQARAGGTCLAILFVDLDDFKNVNDTLGHAAGDELLKAAALRLKSLIRASDHVVRLGGDEFTLVLQQVHGLDDVSRVASMIVRDLSEPFTLAHSGGHLVQASIGISVYPQDGSDGETLLKHADIAMYAAKAGGKGRFHFYHSHLSDRLVARLGREQALRQAIERDEFVLYYQPRVDTLTGRLSSMEALVRWMHPQRGVVPPLEFIQMAEDTGLILKLGRMVIDKACAQLAQWKAQGLPVVPVSINVSALQFNDGNVNTVLAASMAEHGIDPSLIGIELTESCMVGEDATVMAELDGLRTLGVKLLVDDFGTGYSSLSQLQRLNVDVLKVDRAFTMSLSDGGGGRALFKAIVSMADALDICIVAEGVETDVQLHALQSLACDEVQGHLVSRPVAAAEMAKLMVRRFLFPPTSPGFNVVQI